MSFNVLTYPGLQGAGRPGLRGLQAGRSTMPARTWPRRAPWTVASRRSPATCCGCSCDPTRRCRPRTACRSHPVPVQRDRAATPMTRDEFVAQQTADALSLRSGDPRRPDGQRRPGQPGGRPRHLGRRVPGGAGGERAAAPGGRGAADPADPKVVSTARRAGQRGPGRPGRQPDPEPDRPDARSSTRCTAGTAITPGKLADIAGYDHREADDVRRLRHPDPGAAAVRRLRPRAVAPDALRGLQRLRAVGRPRGDDRRHGRASRSAGRRRATLSTRSICSSLFELAAVRSPGWRAISGPAG